MSKFTDVPLSTEQVQQVAGFPVPLFKYSDLLSFNSIDQLLNNRFKAVLLLYEWEQDSGHWAVIFRNKDGINYFNSFGYMPDDVSSDTIPQNLRKRFGQSQRHLSYLLSNTNAELNYNEHIVQDDKANTCGRWCGYRLRQRNKSLYEFVKPFDNAYQKGLNLDDLIIKITNKYL